MTNRIQFGFCMPADNLDPARRSSYVDDINRALDLVDGHFDSAWCIDHLQFGDTDVLEGWTLLTYFAALHPGLRFGHSVLCQSFRNPALLAKMGAALQLLSGGRFLFGIGAGWHAEEYEAYGYDFPAPALRVAQLEEALHIIRELWTKPQATYYGVHHRVVDARCHPRPDPLPPIMIGAFKPKMLQLTATYADWWNVSSTDAASYKRMAETFDRICARVGRDPRSVRRTWGGGCVCRENAAAAWEVAGDRYSADASSGNFDLVGTPDQITEQIEAFVALGIDYFILDCGGFPDLTTLELLVQKVLPRFMYTGADRPGSA